MIFGIDYDGVFGNDPKLFRMFVSLARELGHECYIVSARDDTPEHRAAISQGINDALPCPIQIILTGHRWKKLFCDKLGIKIDVWIDDACTEILPAPEDPKRMP